MPFEIRELAQWEARGEPGLLSVIIPAHNEQGHIAATAMAFDDALSDAGIRHEILIVDDNSTDQTSAIAQALALRRPAIRCIANPPPHGYGCAVRRGLQEFCGDAVLIAMADLSDDPSDAVAFYRKLQDGYDCVFGTRFSRGGHVVDYPLHKLILNRLGNLSISMLFRMRYDDTTNAFKMFRRSVIAGLQPLLAYQFDLTVELPLKAIVRGYRYAVLPNSWSNRKFGISKFRVREMGSRYYFIIFYCLLERFFARQDYHRSPAPPDRVASLQGRAVPLCE